MGAVIPPACGLPVAPVACSTNGAVFLTIVLPVFATFVPDRDRMRATGFR